MHRFAGRQGVTADREPFTQTRISQLEDELLHAQKFEAVGLLVGGLAHDFNNTLMVAGGYADLIHAEADSPQIRAYSEAINAVVGRGKELTRQLLAFARPTRSTIRAVDVGVVVTGVMPLIRRLTGPGIELDVQIPARPMLVRCDPCQLEQALMNLAINARDAMSAGGRLSVVVTATRRRTSDRTPPRASSMSGLADNPLVGRSPTTRNRRFVEIGVQDSGCGIAAAHLDRVFEPFFTTKPVGLGSGLGLPMVRRFATHAGGDVTVKSAVGVGTTVTVRLPRAGVRLRRAVPVGRVLGIPVNGEHQQATSGRTALAAATVRA